MIFLRLRENIMLPPHCAPKSVTIGLKRTGHQIDCMIVKLTGYPRSTVKTSWNVLLTLSHPKESGTAKEVTSFALWDSWLAWRGQSRQIQSCQWPSWRRADKSATPQCPEPSTLTCTWPTMFKDVATSFLMTRRSSGWPGASPYCHGWSRTPMLWKLMVKNVFSPWTKPIIIKMTIMSDQSQVQSVMATKKPAKVMVLGVITSDSKVDNCGEKSQLLCIRMTWRQL